MRGSRNFRQVGRPGLSVIKREKILDNVFLWVFMPPKELWEAYSNCTVRPRVRPSRFVSGAYLLDSLR